MLGAPSGNIPHPHDEGPHLDRDAGPGGIHEGDRLSRETDSGRPGARLDQVGQDGAVRKCEATLG